jgi:hypothetical protein
MFHQQLTRLNFPSHTEKFIEQSSIVKSIIIIMQGINALHDRDKLKRNPKMIFFHQLVEVC